MLDLAKSFSLIVIYLLVFLSLGGLVLRILKTDFSFSLGILSGFFFYHLLFSLVALPCILTQQTLTLLMSLWLPLLGVAVLLSVWLCRVTFLSAIRQALTTCREQLRKPSSLLLPAAAAACVLFVLYLSVCSYYVGWDTAFYVRTTLHAVENDSMYTLDAATGMTASTLSLRYALSPFYMNSAIFCRLLNLHPLLVQNITDGCICVLLAFMVIYRIGLRLFQNDRNKTSLVIIFAAVIHISHASLFSTSDFLLLRSYEAKAYCANIVLPFIFYHLICLWKDPENRTSWWLLFLSLAASNGISMSSLLTAPFLVAGCSLGWLFRRDWRSLRNTILCLIPSLLYIIAYLLDYAGIIAIPIA